MSTELYDMGTVESKVSGSMADWILVFCQLSSRPRRWASSFSTFNASRRSSIVCIIEISERLCAQRRPMRCTLKNPIYWEKKYHKLEISGKAQPESARRPKPNWGKLEGGKIFPTSKSHGPNSNALAYTEHALST